MRVGEVVERAHVIYRATGRGNRPVEVHLVATPAAATVGDAWTRLTQVDATVDPRSLEIETRLRPRSARGTRAAAPRTALPIDLARWLAGRAAMAHDACP
jgi:hypothetical protein